MESKQNSRSSNIREVEVRGIKVKRKPMFDQTGKILLNGVQVTFEKGFGFNQTPQLKNNAYSIDDNRTIYLLTKQIVLYDNLAQTQKVINSIGQQQQITAFVYFKNIMLDDNIIYAVHAINKTYPTIVMHNFSKNVEVKYVLSHLQKQQQVKQIVLLNENRHFCIVSELQNTFRVSIMDIQSKQLYASQSIYFKPLGMVIPFHHTRHIIIYSQTQIYMIILDRQIKLIQLNIKKYFSDSQEHIVQLAACLHNELILYVITDKGFIYFVGINLIASQINKVQKQFLGTFQTVDANNNKIVKNKMPSTLCCNEYNIVIGYYFVQQFTLIKVCSVSTQYNSQHIKFSAPNLHKIVRMNFAYETMAICVIVQVKQNDKYGLTIPIQSQFLKEKGQQKIIKQNIHNHSMKQGKIFPIVFNLLLHDTLVETLRSPIQSILSSMLLTKQILDICVIPTKKMIFILSEKRIKAIKYQHVSTTSFDRILAWQTIFNPSIQQPQTLDTHPLTFHVAVGFKDGLKIYNIAFDGLKAANIQFPMKNCQSVRYSKFGHLLAAGSANQILLVNPYEHEVVHNIPLNHGYQTIQLNFIDRDMYVFGSFSNGSNMVLNLQGGKIFEVYQKNTKMLCSAYDCTFDVMIVSFVQCVTKFYRDHGSQQFAIMWTYPFNITKLLICNELGTIFMGTSLGKIRAYQWPFTDMIKFNKSFTQVQLHSTPVTQIKITHDLSMIITGAEDGSIFISKINAYSDGLLVNDSEIMHTFKTVNKNYMSLYYLQNYICTTNNMQSQQQQIIIQLQSDKADFEAQYNDAIITIHEDIDAKVKQQQITRNQNMKLQMMPHERTIQSLNEKKQKVRQQLHSLQKRKVQNEKLFEEQKLQKMRSLYLQSDQLKEKRQFYQQLYSEQFAKINQKYKEQFNKSLKNYQDKTNQIQKNCKELETQCKENIVNYKQLMKQEQQEGQLYKQTMLTNMANQLISTRQRGQQLRKMQNKTNHEISKFEQKIKYFQQLVSEIQIDIVDTSVKNKQLKEQLEYLSKVLSQKDKQIFDEERTVKQLLTTNINNYSHEEYLKHRQQQLLAKAIFLQNEIEDLDNKYKVSQQNFIQSTKQTNQCNNKIHEAIQNIRALKKKYTLLKQKKYKKGYEQREVINKIIESFHHCPDVKQFSSTVKQIFNTYEDNNRDYYAGNKVETVTIDKCDHMIKQVINTNNLRKIDDTIRRTIMLKLNRQTVNLTCQVNELRKQKRNLNNKIKQLKDLVYGLNETDQKQNNSLRQIVPVNISVIKSSSQNNNSKLLPFQIYHQNKNKTSISKSKYKSEYEQNSTQLPSIVKHSHIQSSKDSTILYEQKSSDQILQ